MHLLSAARAVVSQSYITEAENEYVIRANSAIMKCKIPSFVTEFIYVDQWVTSEGTIYTTGREYGKKKWSLHAEKFQRPKKRQIHD